VFAPRSRAFDVDPVADRMPVGFVVFQTRNRANGGVESITQVVERARRIRPIMVTQLETETTQRWRDAGLAVHVLSAAYEAWSEGRAAIRHALRNNVWAAEWVRRERLRVVHVNDVRAWTNTAPGARAAGARVVLSVRGTRPAGQRWAWRSRIAAATADVVLANSREGVEDVRENMIGRLPTRATLDHVYSAADLERFTPVARAERAAVRRALGIPDDRIAIAYVAAVAPLKGQLAFLEHGLAALVAAVPRALVCFVGDFRPDADDYARRCRDALAASGLAAHVRFVGYTNDTAAWYRAADVTMLASHAEGLARCMIESIACGTPVVSADVCGAREILEDHGCGVVVPRDDYAALAAAVRALAGDEPRRSALGRAGIDAAHRLFDPEETVRRYEDVYRRLGGRGG
jgi:glycosyltransferase involved in cell wall biosynthesis